MKNFKNILVFSFVLVMFSASAILLIFAQDAEKPETPQTTKSAPAIISNISQFQNKIYKNASKAVVSIISSSTRRFGEPSTGTGFFIDANGHILTSFLNVGLKDEEIEVTMFGGKRLKASVVGKDVKNSCVLLKLVNEQKSPAFLKFGDSKNLKLGKIVFSVSDSFGELSKTYSR